MEANLQNNYYEKYVGNSYAKRFYTPFEKENIFKIIAFKLRENYNNTAHFMMSNDEGECWWWDVEDCVIITNEPFIVEDSRIANINDPEYKGYNPFK